MKVKAIVEKVEKTQDGFFVTLKTNGKTPKEKTIVTISYGRVRSKSQNSIYWVWLNWVIENGGRDQGYLDSLELHEVLKGRLLCSKKEVKGIKTIVIKSTTELTTDEFIEYMDKCEHIINDYLGINSQGFYQEYAENYGG